MFCTLYVLYTVLVSWRKKSYLKYHKEEEIHLWYCTAIIEKKSTCKWTHEIQTCVVQGSIISIWLLKNVQLLEKFDNICTICIKNKRVEYEILGGEWLIIDHSSQFHFNWIPAGGLFGLGSNFIEAFLYTYSCLCCFWKGHSRILP